MKTFKKLASILLVAISMTMVACDPEDVLYPDPELYKTVWINEQTDTYEDEYGNQHESVETTIISFDAPMQDSGHMEYKYVTDTRNENYSYPFTFTYLNPNGTITISKDGNTETFNFTYNVNSTYNDNDDTMTLYVSEEYYIVFSRLQE